MLLLILNAVVFSMMYNKEVESTLIWISLDGFKNSYLDENITPNLFSLAKSGVKSLSHQPNFVSKTFPNHLSAVTGMYEDEHGIINNNMYDENMGYFDMSTTDVKWWDPFNKTKPIWTENELNGGRSAVIFWPGNNVEFSGIYPTFYTKKYSSTCGYKCRLEMALDLIKTADYNLVMIYISEIDQFGHEFGPSSKEVAFSLLVIDREIGNFVRVVDKISKSPVNYMITSDHGMADMKTENTLYLSEIIPSTINYFYVTGGTIAQLNVENEEKANQIIEILNKFDNVELVSLKQNIPQSYHYSNSSRIPTITIIMKEGYAMLNKSKKTRLLGDHGYPMDKAPSMNALFIGKGPFFIKENVLNHTEMNDLYIIAMFILGISISKENAEKLIEMNVLGPTQVLSNFNFVLLFIILFGLSCALIASLLHAFKRRNHNKLYNSKVYSDCNMDESTDYI